MFAAPTEIASSSEDVHQPLKETPTEIESSSEEARQKRRRKNSSRASGSQ